MSIPLIRRRLRVMYFFTPTGGPYAAQDYAPCLWTTHAQLEPFKQRR